MNFKYLILLCVLSITKLECTSNELILKQKLNENIFLHSNNTINQLETYLQDVEKRQHFSGVVVMAKEGKIILNRSYGIANIYGKNDKNTIFHVASITKQFTAAAILKLWQSGKIDLHASINLYLPKEYQSDIWEKVTVHHLLSHTSGIIDYDETYYNAENKGFCFKDTIKKMIAESQKKKLEFEPGKGWHYCNIGYSLLGIILESQTGQSYSNLVQEYFFIPTEMFFSGIHDENYSASINHAMGYRWDKKRKKLVEDDEKTLPATPPDGSMFTTLDDLYKWSHVLSGKRPNILSSEIIKLMIKPNPNSFDIHGGYGYGLFIDDSFNTLKIHHPGWISGFRSHFCLYPKEEIYISVFCNNTATDPMEITLCIAEIMGIKNN